MWDLLVSIPDHCLSFYSAAFRLKWIGVVLTRLFIIIVELGSFQGQISH